MKNTLFSRYMTAVVVLFLAAQTGAWGAIFTWNGLAGDGLWETPGNWTLTDNTVPDAGADGVPNGGDSARIASAVTVTTPAAGVSVLGLTITAGATLTLGGDLTVTGETWNADEAFYLESTGITINLGGNDITAGKTHFGLNNQCGLTVNGAGNFTTNTVDTREEANNSVALYNGAKLVITTGGFLDHSTGSMLFTGDSASTLDIPTTFSVPAPTNVTAENIKILIAGVPFTITANLEATGIGSEVKITGDFDAGTIFYFTATVTNLNVTSNESYTINSFAYDASVAAKTTFGTSTTSDTYTTTVTIPDLVDSGDGITLNLYMSYLPIGSIQFIEAGKKWDITAVDGLWATAANWIPAGAPVAGDIVTIPAGGTQPTIAASTTATAKQVTVQSGATLTFGSGSTLTADKIINNGTVNLFGNEALPPTRITGTDSTITYKGTGTTIWGSTYENLTINASGIITAASALVVNEDLAVTAGTLTAQGNVSVSGALSISSTGSANFNAGAGAQASSANSVSFSTTGTVGLGNDSGDSFAATTGNLALEGAASFVLAGTINAGGTITLGENASLAADTVFSKAAALTGSVNMTTGGNDLTLTGGFDCDGNTITLTGGGTLNNPVSIAVGTGTLNFADGTLAGAGSVSISTGTLEITGTAASLTVTDNSIIDMQGAITSLTVSGGVPTVTGTGTGLTIGGNPGGAISTDGTVTITGTAFTDITNSGTLTISNAATLSGNLVVTAGSVSASSTLGVGGNVGVEAGTTLEIGGDLTVTGNWTNNGATFTHNSNGVVFTPAALGTSTITGNTGFADLTCANQGGETLAIAGDIGVTGTLTLSGTGTGTSDRLTITGTGSIALTVPQTTGQYLLVDPNIVIAPNTYTAYSSRASATAPAGWVLYASASGFPVTWTGTGLNANWDNPDNWDALAVPGSIDEVVIPNIGLLTNYPVANVAVNAAEITVDANAEFTGNGQSINATGDFSNSGTVRLVGTEAITISGTTTNVAGSTVEYNGTGSAVWPNDAYQNLTITAAGVVSLGTDAVTVAGTLLNEGEINVNGTGSINTSDAANGTFRYSGTDQPVPTLDGYNNLIIDCTGDATAGGDITVGGNLTLTTGTLVMGANGLTVKGDIVKTDGIITSGGTITLDGTTPQSADLADGTNDSQITNLLVNNALGVTLNNTESFTWSGNCNITAGTLTLANVTGQAIGGTVTVSGTGGLELSGGSLTAGAITVSNSSGTGIMLSATATTALSAASASFSGGFGSVNINNIAFTLTGTGANVWTDSGFTGTWTAPASGSVAFSGTAPEISSSHALYDISIADSTTLTALTALDIRNAEIGTSGAASLVLANATQTFRGSATGTGTLDASAIGAANTLTVQGNLGVLAGTALSGFLAPAGAVNVEGNWNVTTLTLAGTPGTLSFIGSTNPATIQSNGQNLGVLAVNKTNTTDIVRLSGNLTCGQLTLTRGVLDADANNADIVAAGFVDSDGSGTVASFSGAGQTVTITGGNLRGVQFTNLAVTSSATMTGNVTATGSAAFSGSGALTLGGHILEAASVARTNDAGTGAFLIGGGSSAVTAGSVSIEGTAGTINLSGIAFTLTGTGVGIWTDSGYTTGTWTAPTSGSLTFSGAAPQISSSHALYDIAVENGSALTLTTELICHNLAIGTTLPTAQVAANGDNQITVGGNVTGTGTLNASALTSATVDINGNIGVAAYSAAAVTEVAGNWTVPAAGFTHNNRSVVFNGTGNLNSAGTSFYDIEFSDETMALAGFTAENDLTINSSGTLTASGAININVGRNWTKNAAGTFSAGSSTVSFDPGTSGAYGQEHTITGDTTFNNLSLDASGAGVERAVSLYLAGGSNQTISGALTLRGKKGQLLAVSRPAAGTGSWTITSSESATVEFASISSGNADGADITASNSINAGNNDDATTTPFWVFGAIAWTGSTDTDANLDENWATGTVPGQYDRATVPGTGTASNQPTQTATMTLRALTLSETTSSWSNGGQNLTVSSTLANDGTFTFTGAGMLNLPATTAVSPLGGTFVYSGGTISMESELAGYTNLTVSGGSITGQTATVTGTLSVTGGTLTVPDSATLTLNGAAHTVSGGTLAIAGGGSINAGTNGFTVGTTGSLTMGTAATSGGTLTCGTLNLGNTSGSGTIISAVYPSTVNAATVTITGAAGSTANINNIDFVLTGESDWNDSGFAGTWTPPTGGSLTINGSATPTIRSTHGLYSLTVNPGALNAVSINTDPLRLAGNLTLQSGTLSVGALGLSVAGDISDNTNTGELTFTTGTLTLDGSTAQTVDLSQATLYNLTIDNTFATSPQVTATGAASLSGTLALNGGILDMGANQLTLTGTGSITNDGTGGGGIASTGTIEFSGGGTQTADLRNSTLGSATITSAAKTGGSLSFPRGFIVGIFSTGAAGYSINFNTTSGSGGETTTLNNGGGGVAFSNTGTLSIGNENTDVLVCTNGITATGTGTNSFRGTLRTDGVAEHNISLDDLGISEGTLVLDAGAAGTISVAGATSGSGFNLTIANSNGATFSGAVGSSGAALGTVTLTDTSDGQTIAFNGGLYAATLATETQGYNLSIGGGANGQTSVITTVTGAIAGDGVIRNTGTLALGNHAVDSVTFTNGLTNVSAVSSIGLGGTIASTDTGLTLNDLIILNANTILSSGTGDLSAGGTIDSAAGQNYSLTLNSSGTATLAGEAGGTRPLLSLTTDAGGSTILQAVTTLQTISIGDDATLNGTLAVNTAGYGVSIAGNTTLNAGSGTIRLTGSNAANDITFTGPVAGARTLDLTATGGNIVFGDTVGSGTAVAGIVVQAANTVDFDNSVATGSGGLDITAGTTDFAADVSSAALATAGPISITGNLTTSAALTIRTNSTTDGAFSFVTGTFNATGGTLTLDLGATDFTAPVGSNFGTVIVSSVNNITLNDTNGIILGTSTIGENLVVSAGGAITDSGNIAVTGTTNLSTTAAAVATLDNDNNFGGAVTAGGSISDLYIRDTGALRFASVDITGNLTAIAAGTIDQTGAILVDGTAQFTAGAANDITLTTAVNDFEGAVSVVSARNVSVHDANALTLGNITAAGTISAETHDSGSDTITIAGTVETTSATAGITLNTPGGAGDNIVLSSGGFTLGGGTGTGIVDIQDNAELNITGTFTLSGGSIEFDGHITRTAGTLAIGSQGMSVAGDITGSAGAITFTAGESGNLTLNGAAAQSVNLAGSTIQNLTIYKTAASPNDTATFNNGTAFTWNGSLTLTDGTLAMANLNQTIGGSVTGSGSLTAPTGATLTVSGPIWNPTGFTRGSGAVAFNATTSIASPTTFHNLTTSGTVTLNTDIEVANNLTVTGGTLAVAATRVLTVSANSATVGTTVSAGTLSFADTAEYAGGSAIFTVSETGAATVGTGDFAAGAMTVSSSAAQGFRQNGLNSPSGNQTVGSLTVGAGATCVWDNPAAGGDLTINGNLANGGTLNFNNKQVTIGGTVTGAITVYDLYIPTLITMSPGASSTITVRRNMIIDSDGHYVPNASSTLILGGPASVAGGEYTDSNTTADNIGTVQVTGTQPKALASHMTTNNLTVDVTLNLDTYALTVNGNLSGSGTVTATGSQNITISGSFTPANFNAATSTVIMNSGSTPVNTGGLTYNNLTLEKGAADDVVNLGSGASIGGTLTITKGTLAQGGDLTVTGDIEIEATGRLNTGDNNLSAASITESGEGAVLNASGQTTAGRTVTFNASMSLVSSGFTAGTATTLISSGTGDLTSAGNNVGNFEKTTDGTLTLLDALDVNGNLNITAGILAANDNNITLAGNWTNGGTFTTGTTQTVVLDGAGNQTIVTNNQFFYNLTIGARLNGTVTFTDALNVTNPAAGLTTGAGAYNIAINDGGSAANLVSFNNTGTLTINTSAEKTFSLPLGAVKTSGEKILSGTIALSGAANLNFGTAGQVSIPVNCWIGGSTGTITLWDAVIADGATLTLGKAGNAGTASANSIVLNSASGTASNITFDNLNANVTVEGNIGTDIGTVSLEKTGGLARFSGDISAATLSTNAGAYSITIEGGTGTATATTITNAVIFNNSGSLALGNALEDEFEFAAGFTHTAGATELFGDFNTTNAPISLAAAALAGQTEITTSTAPASGGTITMESLAGPFALGVTAGTGNFTVTGAVGANDATRLGAITISSAGNASFDGAVYCQSLAQTAGSGTTSFAGILDMSDAAGADLNGTNFSFAGAVASAGPLDITHTGTLILPDAADCVLQGRFLQDGTGTVSLGADISTTGDAITFTGPITLTHNAALNATAGGSAAGADVLLDAGATLDGPFNLAIEAGAGTIVFSENIGASQAVGDGTGASVTALTSAAAAEAVYFLGTVRTNNGLSVQGNATATENISVLGSETGTVFTKNTVLDGLDFASAGSITFGSSAANTFVLSAGAVLIDADGSLTVNARTDGAQDLTLAVTGDSTFNGAVGSATAIGDGTGASITINSTGATLFETDATVRTATGISQANAAGKVTFRANVSVLSAETPSAFQGNLAINPAASFEFDTAGELAIGNAATDTLDVTGAAGKTATFRTRDPANGRITLNSAASSDLSVWIENAGIFRTNEDADLRLYGSAAFTQTAPAAPIATITDNRAMIAGSIASAGGAIRFDSETFIFGSEGDMTLEAAGNAAIDSIYFAQDLHVAAGDGTANKTVVFGSAASSESNIILTQGRLGFGTTAARRALTSKLDQVYLNGNPADMFADADSGVASLRAYENAARAGLTAFVNGSVRNAYPDGSAMPALYTGEIDGATLSGKTIFIGKNFYANGTDFAAADAANPWTISLPDNNDALAAFAEAYRSEIANSRVTVQGSEATGAAGDFFAWVSAAENCTDGGGNAVAASDDGTLSVSAGWSFSRPYLLAENSSLATGAALSGTYTVFDDVVRVEFRDEAGNARRIENSRGEIAQAVANGAVTFNGDGTARTAFSGAFKDPACTVGTNDVSIPNEKGEIIDLSVFYIRTNPADPTQRWNTDATGSSPGDIDASDGTASTDRGRIASAPYSAAEPITRSTIPDIEIAKATTALYQTLRDEHKNRIAHYLPGGGSGTPARFTATGDRCRPVLVEVKVGKELHVSDPKNNPGNYHPWDAHNYFELRWSEPVTIGNLTDTGTFSANVRSTHNFDSTSPYGGAMELSGGNLSVSGYFSATQGSAAAPLSWQDGTRNLVSTPADPDDALSANSLYRSFALNSTQAALENGSLTEPAHPHRLRIYLAGYADELPTNAGSWKWFWPGHIDEISDPIGAEVLPVTNPLIRDRAGHTNAIEPFADDDLRYGIATSTGMKDATSNKATRQVTAHVSGGISRKWDTTFPDVAAYREKNGWAKAINSQTVFEASPIDTIGDGFMDRIEFHIFDDAPLYEDTEPWQWVSSRGWYSGIGREDSDLLQPVPDSRGGMRSSSVLSGFAGDGSFLSSANGFLFSKTKNDLTNAHSETFGTTVISRFFNPDGSISLMDDGYLAVFLNGLTWRMNEQMYYSYNENDNFLTDLAGLRLKSHGPRECLNKTPPEFTFTLQPMSIPGVAGPGDQKLYILFSKPIDITDLEQNLLLNNATGENLIDIKVKAEAVHLDENSDTPNMAWDAILTLRQPLSLEEIQTLQVVPVSVEDIDPDTGTVFNLSNIRDKLSNAMNSLASHRVTDLGINLALPLYASDGINTDGTFAAGQGALRVFDGSGRLLDRDITISTEINTGRTPATEASSSMQLYYDVNPNISTFPVLYNDLFSENLKLWLPSILPSFNSAANIEARSMTPEVTRDDGRIRNFIIPSSDAEIETGASVEFLFKYGDLFCVRLTDPANILSVDPWRFSISALKTQRGGVTILNNVIDSNKREKTLLTVEMPKSGNLVIHVFTMDGNIVRTLERNKKGAGTYTYTWDGSNLAGNAVARGMYFIRVVGPDMDEIRKVMVVKE